MIRGEASRPGALRNGELAQPVGGLSVVAILLGICYGLCMGCFGLFQRGGAAAPQMLATMIKVPALFFLTLAVTLPSLYVFNALVGSRLAMLTVVRVLVISLAVMLAVLASLGPIVAFFSASTASYPFILLLNVVVFSISGYLGLRFLKVTLARLSDGAGEQSAPPEVSHLPVTTPGYAPVKEGAGPLARSPYGYARRLNTVFTIWMIVFSLVGGQMAWVLRPFLGRPNAPFTFLRGREFQLLPGRFRGHALSAPVRR